MAQTGVVLLALSIVPFALLTPICRLPRVVGYFGIVTLVLAMASMWYWQNGMSDERRELVSAAISAKTDFITNYMRYGYVGNDSFDYMKTMYVAPESAMQIVFGNSIGLWSDNPADPINRLRLRSDIGYVVDLGGIGLIGVLLSLVFYGSILMLTLVSCVRRHPAHGSLVLLTMATFFLSGHAKEVRSVFGHFGAVNLGAGRACK
jgi:hypothetical protein